MGAYCRGSWQERSTIGHPPVPAKTLDSGPSNPLGFFKCARRSSRTAPNSIASRQFCPTNLPPLLSRTKNRRFCNVNLAEADENLPSEMSNASLVSDPTLDGINPLKTHTQMSIPGGILR